MSQFNLSILHGFQSLSLSLKEVAALQFFRHPPVRSVSLGIFSHLLSYGRRSYARIEVVSPEKT